MDVMFGVMAVDYPRLKITPDYAVITGIAHASMYVNDNGRIVEAFTLQLVSIIPLHSHWSKPNLRKKIPSPAKY